MAETSTLLTPFRALAIAVDNEQRAFAYFSYLAARTDDPKLAAEAEALAQQELRHAALLRTWRHAAWRRERENSGSSPRFLRIENRDQLVELIAEHERAVALCHRALAKQLAKLDDSASAALLVELAGLAEIRAAHVEGDPRPVDLGGARTAPSLLLAAQTPLERLSEVLETVLTSPPDAETQTEAQEALGLIVARIARIGRRIELLEND